MLVVFLSTSCLLSWTCTVSKLVHFLRHSVDVCCMYCSVSPLCSLAWPRPFAICYWYELPCSYCCSRAPLCVSAEPCIIYQSNVFPQRWTCVMLCYTDWLSHRQQCTSTASVWPCTDWSSGVCMCVVLAHSLQNRPCVPIANRAHGSRERQRCPGLKLWLIFW